jgi:hypothetical protein
MLDELRTSQSVIEYRESNVIFVMFHTRLQSTDFIVVVLVRRPRQKSDFEDEHEKYQIRSPAYALTPYVKLSLGIVSPPFMYLL